MTNKLPTFCTCDSNDPVIIKYFICVFDPGLAYECFIIGACASCVDKIKEHKLWKEISPDEAEVYLVHKD